MGGDHHHGHAGPKVPDYKIYKVENCPELIEVKNALASHGLKDPWLRNEAWRFNPNEFKTETYRARKFFFRGVGIGLAALGVTICLEYAWDKLNPSEHDHHGHGGH